MKDWLFGLATLAFVIAIGGVFWQLLSTESRPLAAPSASISDGGDLLHQQNLEAGQTETNQLLASVIDTLILVNPSPTPAPTKAPTSTPRPTIAAVTCGEWLSPGTICEIPKAKPTKVPDPTQTPIVDCSLTTPTSFRRDYCIWQGATPIPWSPLP